jgi:hypothetical protein
MTYIWFSDKQDMNCVLQRYTFEMSSLIYCMTYCCSVIYQINKNGMGGVCGTHVGGERFVDDFGGET